MSCRRIRRLIPLAAGGDLSPREQDRVLSHLERCSTCREEYRVLSQILESTRAWLREERQQWREGDWREAVRSASETAKSKSSAIAPWPFRKIWAYAVMAASAALLFLITTHPGLITERPGSRHQAGIQSESQEQDVLHLTFVSHESGLQIQWFFNKDFEWKENK